MDNLFIKKVPLYFETEESQLVLGDSFKILTKMEPESVVRNVEEIKVELNILNSLIGSKNIEEEFEIIVKKYPETLKCVPLLLAVI